MAKKGEPTKYKTVGFFSKSVKISVKRGAKRESLKRP